MLPSPALPRLIALVVALSALAACGGDKTPTGPSTQPPPQESRVIRLEAILEFGDVQIGESSQRTLRIYNEGNSPMTVTSLTGPAGGVYVASWTNGTIPAGGNQGITIAFSPTEERSYSGTLTVAANHTSGSNTTPISGRGVRPPGPRTSFGNGQWRVGADIAPGRYFSDPTSLCYWERQSGLGGSFGEIIANEFVGFNALQWIVDILAGDVAFDTEDCGTWFTTPRHPFQSTLRGGVWLVGTQLTPGTYRTNASAGCYWERLRDFQSRLSSINDNDFRGSAGQALVTIRSTDVGFRTDDECGTWTLEGSSHVSDVFDQRDEARIAANRAAAEARRPIRRR